MTGGNPPEPVVERYDHALPALEKRIESAIEAVKEVLTMAVAGVLERHPETQFTGEPHVNVRVADDSISADVTAHVLLSIDTRQVRLEVQAW